MNSLKILAIDPSSNEIGVAVLFIDSATFEVKNIITHYLGIKKHKSTNDNVEPLVYRMDYFYDEIKGLIEYYKPHVMAYERGFMNPRTPGAFGPINTCTSLACRAAISFNRFMRITQFSPGQVKNAMGQKGNCGKDDMKAGCKAHPIVNKFVNPDLISEHEIDAIAVGLCATKYYSENRVLLF